MGGPWLSGELWCEPTALANATAWCERELRGA